ncbi:MAG: ABC transporter permease [Anaerolineae bacterium]|nr:ABC transporter permease [Anaerolineae bacterium]
MSTSEATPLIVARAERNPTREFWRRLLRNRAALISLLTLVLLILLAAVGPSLYAISPIKPDYAAINSLFTGKHPLGTDNLGRDTLARLLYGLRVSLIVAFYVETLNVSLGVTLGLVAGYFGGIPDVIITRIADMLFAFPGLLLAILIAAVFGTPVTERFGGIGRLLLVAGAISLVSWPLMARLVRSQTLVLKEQEFVLAARSLGASDWQILAHHVLPNLIGQVIVAVTLDIGGVVVSESVLSLLGLGIQPPDPSIGKMITDSIPYLEANAWQVIVPSLALMLIVMSASFLGDGLRDAFDPGTQH